MAKRRHSRRKHRRGTSGLKGLRSLGNIKSGMGRDVIPPLVAGVLTAGTALGIRAYVTPTPGAMSETVYKNAPLIGAGVGVLGAVALYFVGGAGAATSAAIGSLLTGGALFANDKVVASGGPLASTAIAPSATAGFGAVLPEYAARFDQTGKSVGVSGLDGIVMEKLNGGPQGLGAMGDDVNLSGTVNSGAFGTAPFGGN